MSNIQDNVNNIEARRSILEMSNEEARTFLLKEESYCNFKLPPYIVFGDLLQGIADFLENNNLAGLQASKPRDEDHLNHIIINNKDGKYAWRPLQLINPILYVSLVHEITKNDRWADILNRFQEFSSNPKIRCLSLPVESLSDESDTAEQVSNWWMEVEQKSIELALEYEYLTQTDIIDCYGSIYTHTIAWSLHKKSEAKKKENRNNKDFIGVLIDDHLQDMAYAQTNGIPQGSVLMDFIAEMVLGYADQELTNEIIQLGIEDYQILRYRDDYRIFSNSPQNSEKILKALTKVLIDLSFKINSSKTSSSNQVIQNSIKADKLQWLMKVKSAENLQKRLLIIHNHSVQFPNSGSVAIALTDYYKRLQNYQSPIKSPIPLISIAVDIAYQNPRTYPIISAILSKLISMLDTDDEKRIVVSKIKTRFDKLPNTGFMEIWLQRIFLPIGITVSYDEPICKLVAGESQDIWNTNWVSSRELKRLANCEQIIDQEQIENLRPIVPIEEVELFIGYGS
jgi:RNA-directed DNA polymerase